MPPKTSQEITSQEITSKKYAIFLNGEYLPEEDSFYRKLIEESECTVAVDGGQALFERLSLTPDIILGDFDSSERPKTNFDGEIISYDSAKDKTDGELAVEMALKRGAEEIAICGYRGGSATDQILGNLLLLQRADNLSPTSNVYCLSKSERIWLIRDRSCELTGVAGETVSVIALDNEIQLSASGVRFPARTLKINRGETTAHSNYLLESSCKLTISGAALVFMRIDSQSKK